MAPVKETKQHYTACHLCDLHFLSELVSALVRLFELSTCSGIAR